MNKTQVLFEEYKITNDKVESFLQSQHKYINSILLLLAACLVFVYDSETVSRTHYLFALPSIFLSVFSVFVYHYKRTMVLQGYKKYLEYQINKSLGENILKYGELGYKHMVKNDIISKVNILTYIVIYSILVFFAEINNETSLIFVYINMTYVNIGLGFCVALIAFLERNISKKIYNESFQVSEHFNFDDKEINREKDKSISLDDCGNTKTQ